MSLVDQGSGRSIASDAKWATSLHGGVIRASNVVIISAEPFVLTDSVKRDITD